ncbi:MAG: formylglycine-generating enzyme family protein [Clostridia bacterium]|nr:formylglycine-generating enzyme family protein [Clostridia bacterium]
MKGETDGFKSTESLTSTNSGRNSWILLTTGSTEQVKKMNLYDVSGNLWEWTTEVAYGANLNYNQNSSLNTIILRGGGLENVYTPYSACYRTYSCALITATLNGFRPALFLQ